MGIIRDHKNVLASLVGLAGLVVMFMSTRWVSVSVPAWEFWLAFGLLAVACFYLLLDARRIRSYVMAETEKRSTNAESELAEQAAVTFAIFDSTAHGPM